MPQRARVTFFCAFIWVANVVRKKSVMKVKVTAEKGNDFSSALKQSAQIACAKKEKSN